MDKVTPKTEACTTVFRRWHTTQRDYVDSKGIIIPRPGLPRRETDQKSLPEPGDPTVPPQDGSTPFLSLPTELRLQIYSYLTAEKKDIREMVGPQSIGGAHANPASNTIYTYLWRSPGRVTKANAVPPEIVRLFHVNRRMRLELIDSCFTDRTFVLEASLYRRSVGGLDVLPSRLGTTAWIKKLLLITTLDREKARPNGIADLRPLQEMVNLKELRMLFRALDPVIPGRISNSPVHAVMQCVPAGTKVIIGLLGTSEEELINELGGGIGYLFSGNANGMVAYDRLTANLDHMNRDKGMLSGSVVNHGVCKYLTCGEQHIGAECVNAQTSNALPPPDTTTRYGPFTYPCGCEIKSHDGGYVSHGCFKQQQEIDLPRGPSSPDSERKEVRRMSWRDYLQQRFK